MDKATKKQKPKNFEKEYNKVMKGFQAPVYHGNQQQWAAPGDFFVKFSMYRETSSGATSSNTIYISQ
ncbi:hypothetical protein [Agriterribacter sp.]|mgnify:CR=1 FL=1|uniref:hypothetical protein n=1 Tax=Agriterribacter sp. TaxID=2821509 RepID=UPI002C2A5DB6|nr:hypothetical protein [Agriterribacter sp.]HRO46084.1 hypothetical protein [Agriterribacter sp.]HRQ16144.1 hypothetical protein [Agriterribacter sp.]